MLACSGTGAMEAAVVNVLSPGDTMLALVAGNFGERWAAHRQRLRHGRAGRWRRRGARRCRRRRWRAGARRATRRSAPSSSSSTSRRPAPRHDIEALARITRGARTRCSWWTPSPAPGPCRLETRGLGRGRRGGRQPEGAGPAARASPSSPSSARAWQRVESATAPRFYFDLRRERKAPGRRESAFTPAISHVVALKAALDVRGGAWAASTRSCATRARSRP